MIGSTSLLRPTAARLDWETPAPVFEQYGTGCTLDVCATPENAKCELYFTEADNGLTMDWGSHRCWMNPPYGRAIASWMKKAYEASLTGATVVCFVPARTDTRWWHDYVLKADYEFIKGRVAFARHDGKRSTAPFPSAIVIFRPRCQACGHPRGIAA